MTQSPTAKITQLYALLPGSRLCDRGGLSKGFRCRIGPSRKTRLSPAAQVSAPAAEPAPLTPIERVTEILERLFLAPPDLTIELLVELAAAIARPWQSCLARRMACRRLPGRERSIVRGSVHDTAPVVTGSPQPSWIVNRE
jgi:hypothetical protein